MAKIPLHTYLAANVPVASVAVMQSFGYTVHARNTQELANTIAQFINREEEKGLMALADIHPDAELILQAGANGKDRKLGADGSISELPIPSKIENPGMSSKKPEKKARPQNDYTPVIIASMLVSAMFVSVVGLAFIVKK